MDNRGARAGASREGYLALRRVERQQQLIEHLTHAGTSTARALGELLGVSTRTVERDIERLRDAGVPFVSRPGRTGGISLTLPRAAAPVELDGAEIAAILSALVAVGANSSASASSATVKLVAALQPRTALQPHAERESSLSPATGITPPVRRH